MTDMNSTGENQSTLAASSTTRGQSVLLSPQIPITILSRGTAFAIVAGAMLALFVGVMDQSIVATVGPTIISDLGGLSLYAWVFTAFILSQTVSMPIFGKVSDIYGRKRFFLAGIIIFMAGSIFSGASQTIQELIVFRAVQGVGSGAFFSIGLAIIGASVKPEQRAKILGISGSVFGTGAIMGPTLGSYLVQGLGWRWIFYVNIPLGLASILLIGLRLREKRVDVAKRSLDWLGVASLTGWTSFLLLGLLNGGTTYPWYSWQEALFFAGFVVLLPVFLVVEARAKDPIFPLNLFRNRTVSASFAVQLIRGAVLLSLVVFVSLFVQAALGGTIDDVRNVIYAFVVPFVIGSVVSGQVVSRLGSRTVTIFGLVVITIGALLRAMVGESPSLLQLAATSVPFGLGLGASIASVLTAFQNSVDRRQIGVASSLSTFSQNLGGAIGVGILGTIQLNSLTTKLTGVVQGAPVQQQATLARFLGNPDQVGFLLTSSAVKNSTLSVFLPQIRTALAGSIYDVFLGLLVMGVIGIAASTFIRGLSKEQIAARIAAATGQQDPKIRVSPSGPTTNSMPVVTRRTGFSVARNAYVLIYVEAALIVLLLAALSSEYQANGFMQQWMSQNAAPLGYLLSDYSGAVLVAIVAVVGLLLHGLSRRRKFRVSDLALN